MGFIALKKEVMLYVAPCSSECKLIRVCEYYPIFVEIKQVEMTDGRGPGIEL